MAGTLPRTQAGSQQYNPVGLEVGNLCQTFSFDYYFDTIFSTIDLTFSSHYYFTLPGSLSCEQQGEVDQWDRGGDDLRRCCQGVFFNIDLLDSIGIQFTF